MEASASFIVAALIATTILGLAKGGLAGAGTLATPILALVISPVQAAAILLPILIVQDVISVWAFRRSWNRRIVAVMFPGCVLGIGAGWALAIYWLEPSYLWWLLPVVGALVLSIPLSVYSSRVSLGRALRGARLFVVPEEADPPEELRIARAHAEQAGIAPRFVDAVVNRDVNAMACAVAPRRPAAARSCMRSRLRAPTRPRSRRHDCAGCRARSRGSS